MQACTSTLCHSRGTGEALCVCDIMRHVSHHMHHVVTDVTCSLPAPPLSSCWWSPGGLHPTASSPEQPQSHAQSTAVQPARTLRQRGASREHIKLQLRVKSTIEGCTAQQCWYCKQQRMLLPPNGLQPRAGVPDSRCSSAGSRACLCQSGAWRPGPGYVAETGTPFGPTHHSLQRLRPHGQQA